MYVELINGSLEHRNSNAVIVHSSDIQYEACDTERYASLFQYDNSIVNHFNLVGTVKGYRGILYMERLWIDIDDKNSQANAKKQATALITRLVTEYQVDPNAISICFSGHKGYHIGLHENLFGGFEPSAELPAKIKALVGKLTEGISNIDLGIYNTNRAFRVLNSCHPATSLYKIGLTYDQFSTLDPDWIQALAADPNEAYIFTTEMQPKNAVRKLQDLWQFVSAVSQTDFKVEGIEASDDFFAPAVEGERNNRLFKQACMLFDQSELSFSSIKAIVQNSNIASGNPIKEQELYQIVRSAEQRTRKEVKDDKVRSWFTLAEQAGEIVDALEQKSGNYSLLFDDFDDIIQGDLAGKLIVVAGQGGTKKSIYAQQFLVENCRKNNMRGVYNNQEMSKSQWLKRTMNMLPQEMRTQQVWLELKAEYEKDRDVTLKNLNELLRSDIAKRVIVDYKLAANAGYYRKMIEQVTKMQGKVDMLIVDGLSMMDGKGTEKESAELHTKELKYLANEYNIPVIALVHVTKDIPKHTRDLIPSMRGSGKIYDNGDLFISCSLCVDENLSSEDDLIYRTDIGYLRMFDKRESGATISVVYEFDEKTLRMRPHPILTPQAVEVKRKSNNQ